MSPGGGRIARLRASAGGTLPCVALQAAAIVWAWRPFVGGRHSPFEADIEFYHHPVTRELVEAWSHGRIPLWTDHVYCGFPFFADSQTAAWYPGTLLVAALGPHHGYVLFLLLHALLAAAGMLLLVRAHGGGLAAGFAAGLMVPLSGFFVYETQHPGLFAILAWLPLWLVATRAVFLRPSPPRLALGALPLAMMVFAGTLQVLFGAAILFGGYVAGLLLEARRGGAPRAALTGVAAVAGAQTLALLLCAVVLLPGLAHFPLTARSLGMDYAFASMGSVHPLRLLGLFFDGVGAAVAHLDLGPDFAEAPLSMGSLALPLALVGLLASPRRGVRIALGAAALLLAVVAAGRHGGLHPLLYELLPGAVGALRGMGRAIGPLVVCVALLAGLGLQRVTEPGARRLLTGLLLAALGVQAIVGVRAGGGPEAIGASGVLAVAVVLCLAPRAREAPLRPCLAALVAIELALLGPAHDLLADKPPPPGPERLTGAHLFPSLAEIAAGRFREAAPDDGDGRGERVLLVGFGAANFTFHHGLHGVGGYNPLVTLQYLDFASLANYERLHPREPIRGFVHNIVPGRLRSGLFDAASVRFVVSAVPMPWEGLRLVARYPPHPLTRRPVLLYENPRALPRAYLAYRTQRVERSGDLERWLDADFDGRRTTVFEGAAEPLEGPARIDPVRPMRASPERVVFEVSPEREALLVLTDAWYPGWRARVDGVEAPVLRVNAHFRGVALPAGARRVELRFAPRTFRAGAGVSLAALAGWLLLLLTGSGRFLRTRGI